jgi:epoxyqueuosine reductase
MPDAHYDRLKKDIAAIAAKYGVEVVGHLRLDGTASAGMSKIKNPMELMPGSRAMIIFGKRLMDDRFGMDIYYNISDGYTASVEMMALDLAALQTIERLKKEGHRGEEYTSSDIDTLAALAGLGWIGKSGMFVSKEHGPRLRLKGILTDVDLGEPAKIVDDSRCKDCEECMKACPVGAISRDGIDRKKCAACPLQHRKIMAYSYQNCMACVTACPIGTRNTGRRARQKPH